MSPRNPIGVILRLQRHVCGEHPDAWPGCCGQEYWEHGRGKALAGPCCRQLPEFKAWVRDRERASMYRSRERKLASCGGCR